MDPDNLKRFLVSLPFNLGFNNPLAVRQNLFKALYYAATSEGDLLSTIFPNITNDEIEALKDYSFPISGTNERRPFFNYKQKSSYTHPSNKACSRPFKKGEPVYRCEQCGFDDTCVLCVYCFNKEDHIDHNVYMYISQGDNGGICDCGDPEAFVSTLNCKCQANRVESKCLDRLHDSLRETIKVCLDYILDITNFSVQTLPFIHNNINKEGGILTSEIISNYSSLPSGRYGGAIDENSKDLWYLILWNDEHHDIIEAKRAIIASIGVDSNRAREIADEINLHGNCVLSEAKNPMELLKAQNTAEADGLVATIISARDYMRETIVKYMFNWLTDIIEFSGNSEFRELSKSYLADLLLEPNFKVSKVFPAEFIRGLSINDRRRCFENGLLYDGDFVNLGLCSVKPFSDIKELLKPTHLVLETNLKLDKLQNSRLQYLLAFETRFSSTIRKKLATLIIPPIVSDSERKAIFCDQVVSIYPLLITIMALSDREEHLNTLSEITTQIFTCPKCVSSIFRNNQIGNILGPVTQIIEEHSARWNYESGYPNFVEIAEGRPHSYKSIKKAVIRGIRDVGYLVDKNLDTNRLHAFFSKDNLIMLLLFLRNFQGYWPIERKYGEHVEREVLDFVIHLEYSVPILNITKFIATCTTANKELVEKSAELIIGFLNLRKVKKNAPGIAEFRVSKEPVSFVNPINSLLSYLLQYQGFDNFHQILTNLNEPFINISDISLRSIVLGAQVKVGFWIRNGISVSRQASLYTDSIMSDLAFFRDFHLNQIAAILDDPRASLYNFLDRWELLPWYLNEVSHDKTIYEERFGSIAEKFIVFLYNLIADRINFTSLSPDDRVLHKAKQSICYALCDEPKSYTSLKSYVDIEVNELPELDEILQECVDYQPPTGLVDSGMYRLKPHLFEKLDPLSLHLDSSQFQSVSESLIKNIAKDKKIKVDKVILIPEITECDNEFVKQRLGGFAKTKDFAKMLYKFLQASIDDSNETYLPQLLHLIHAVLRDDELIHGPDYLCESFISIPISDLLLTIVESNMSKHVVQKADFLVDQFISKDKRIIDSLIDCFGEDYMQSYKKRKTILFESEADKRKRIAEERKAKVMKKFAKQREKFLAKNQEFDEKEENLVKVNFGGASVELRTCVLCGETESANESFGILASKTKSSTFWKIPEESNEFSALAFKSLDSQGIPKIEGTYGVGYNYSPTKSPLNNASIEASVLSTCGHGMHFTCYKRAANNMKHFPCPLCHNLHDLFIPSYVPPNDGGGLSESEVKRAPNNFKYNQITTADSQEKSQTLIKALMNDNYAEDESVFQKHVKKLLENLLSQINDNTYLVGINENDKIFNYLQNLSVLIANTIRMNEIATRLDGEDSLANFLDQIPSSAKTLLKSLIQCRALLFEIRNSFSLSNYNYDLRLQIQSFWDSNELLDGTFNEVVVLFFQTDESFSTLARLGYVKLVTIAIYSLLERCSCDPGYFYCLSKVSDEISPSVYEGLLKIIERMQENINLSALPFEKESFMRSIYFSVERILLPFLRQLIIFEDLLTSKNLGDNSHHSIAKFETLEEEIKGQERVDSSYVLTKKLGLPSLNDLIEGIANYDKDESYIFEYKIFDIVLSAKIPKYMHAGILTLEYSGIVRLIGLPKDYNSCITDYDDNSIRGTYDYIVCLHCGAKVKNSKHFHHMNKCCNHTCIFFHPRLNNLRICTHIGHSPFSIALPAPYLTNHGEVKRPRSSGKATLNQFRYNYLNKLWLNQGLYGFVTRSLFGARQSPVVGLNEFTFTGLDDEEEDEDDEDFINDDGVAFVW